MGGLQSLSNIPLRVGKSFILLVEAEKRREVTRSFVARILQNESVFIDCFTEKRSHSIKIIEIAVQLDRHLFYQKEAG